MQSNATIIYPACFLFRKWSLIIIISLDLMIIFYTTFALVGRLQMLDFNSNEINNQNHYPELYNHQILHGGTNLIHNDSNLDDNKEWINQTSMLMEKKMKMETATTTTNNPFDLLSSLAFNNIEIPTVKLTTTTMATETDPFKTSNADDNDNQIDNDVNNRYNRYHDDHNEKSYNDNNTNSSISSFEHSIWFEMFEHRIYQRPKIVAQVMTNMFAYIVCLIGLIGVLRENYFLTTIYAWFGCFSLTTSIIIYVLTWSPELFGKIISNLLFLILLFLYLKDLAYIRLQITNNIIIVT
ncbi:uncharacterized protein LOC113788924 [Dermatophagoides pteronyssinus]|uniref:Probable serine/threonine-protein kinase DDB_G0272254 n=1 Tax=Dermatophagoides pteronyssinus TaxID=6956 RepID=A0A6P6XMQ9_DERPT|nr:probable serine/threonine-protein kinase DDB_G0272254 [Dermatophagoides pteronyssinus]